MRMDHVKALFFDVFGTLVDWRSGVAGAAQALLESKGIVLDWSDFADAWPAIRSMCLPLHCWNWLPN